MEVEGRLDNTPGDVELRLGFHAAEAAVACTNISGCVVNPTIICHGELYHFPPGWRSQFFDLFLLKRSGNTPHNAPLMTSVVQ